MPASEPIDHDPNTETLWVPVRTVAKLWHCHPNTIKYQMSTGRIPPEFVFRLSPKDKRIRREFALWPNRATELLEKAKRETASLADFIAGECRTTAGSSA